MARSWAWCAAVLGLVLAAGTPAARAQGLPAPYAAGADGAHLVNPAAPGSYSIDFDLTMTCAGAGVARRFRVHFTADQPSPEEARLRIAATMVQGTACNHAAAIAALTFPTVVHAGRRAREMGGSLYAGVVMALNTDLPVDRGEWPFVAFQTECQQALRTLAGPGAPDVIGVDVNGLLGRLRGSKAYDGFERRSISRAVEAMSLALFACATGQTAGGPAGAAAGVEAARAALMRAVEVPLMAGDDLAIDADFTRAGDWSHSMQGSRGVAFAMPRGNQPGNISLTYFCDLMRGEELVQIDDLKGDLPGRVAQIRDDVGRVLPVAGQEPWRMEYRGYFLSFAGGGDDFVRFVASAPNWIFVTLENGRTLQFSSRGAAVALGELRRRCGEAHRRVVQELGE